MKYISNDGEIDGDDLPSANDMRLTIPFDAPEENACAALRPRMGAGIGNSLRHETRRAFLVTLS